MIKDEDIDLAIGYLRGEAEAAAQARANVKYLAEFLKVKKAQLARARMMEPDTSAAKAETQALADPAYSEVLEGYKVAVEQDALHSFKREAAIAAIDAWRTQQSNLRAVGHVG